MTVNQANGVYLCDLNLYKNEEKIILSAVTNGKNPAKKA